MNGEKKYCSIYTVSANSSLDRTFYLDKLVFEDINRVETARLDAGGKAVNVARMTRALGGHAGTVTFLGGQTGRLLERMLRNEGVSFVPVRIQNETRNIYNFIEKRTGRVLRINESGPRISAREKESFLRRVGALAIARNDVVCLSGSLPPGFDVTAYKTLIRRAKRKTSRIVLDADGEPLKEGIRERPFLIKPNLFELERATGTRIRSLRKFKDVCRGLFDRGISLVLLTHGEKGAVLCSARETLYCRPPAVKPACSVGCGDAFLAGFLHRLVGGANQAECLAFATACGTAKAECEGTAMPARRRVEQLLKKVKLINKEEEWQSLVFGR